MRNLRDHDGTRGGGGRRDEVDELLGSLGISREAFDRYTSFDEDGLINELVRTVREMKARGAYEPERIAAFFEAISPSLSPDMRERMRNVIDLINGGDI